MSNNNPNSTTLGLRAVVLFYVLYLAYGIVEGYVTGAPDALSLPMTILCVGIMAAGALVLLFLTWKQWKSQKNAADNDPADDEDRLPEEDSEL